MIIDVFYYIFGFLVTVFTGLLSHWQAGSLFINSIVIIMIEIGKWNYIFPIYAVMYTIGTIIALEFVFYVTDLSWRFLRLLRGGG